MDINIKPGLISFLFISLLLSVACNRNRIPADIPITDYYDTCDILNIYFGEMVSVGDPEGRFLMKLPYNWDISEHYSDSAYGLVGANFLSTWRQPEDRLSISVSGYQSYLSVHDYYLHEVELLKRDDDFQVLETGQVSLRKAVGYWVLFFAGTNPPAISVVVYLGNEPKNEIFVLQSTVYDELNYRDKLCILKQLVKTFEFLE